MTSQISSRRKEIIEGMFWEFECHNYKINRELFQYKLTSEERVDKLISEKRGGYSAKVISIFKKNLRIDTVLRCYRYKIKKVLINGFHKHENLVLMYNAYRDARDEYNGFVPVKQIEEIVVKYKGGKSIMEFFLLLDACGNTAKHFIYILSSVLSKECPRDRYLESIRKDLIIAYNKENSKRLYQHSRIWQ